jgi:hypothetical protein
MNRGILVDILEAFAQWRRLRRQERKRWIASIIEAGPPGRVIVSSQIER